MIRSSYLCAILASAFVVSVMPGCINHRQSATGNNQEKAFLWDQPNGGVRLGIRVFRIPCENTDLYSFITAAQNITNYPLKIAFGDYGLGPQHPVYVIVDSKGKDLGCIIPSRAYERCDPHNPQPAFPMELQPGDVSILYTSTFVPPLAPGNHGIFARVNPHIPAAPAFENEEWRQTVVDETWASLTGRLESGLVVVRIQGGGKQANQPRPSRRIDHPSPSAHRIVR